MNIIFKYTSFKAKRIINHYYIGFTWFSRDKELAKQLQSTKQWRLSAVLASVFCMVVLHIVWKNLIMYCIAVFKHVLPRTKYNGHSDMYVHIKSSK